MKRKITFRKSEGITLIALVVTIVVLLILAGITITFVLGEGGILDMAKRAADATKNSIANEQADMESLAGDIKNLVGGSTSQKDEEQSDSKIKTANQLEAGESILLPYNSGTIECAVLYDNKYNSDNNKEYGIQIVSKDILEDNYTYKKTDPWDNYIHALNEEIKKYINDTNSMYVSNVRCVGSLPDNPENKEFVQVPFPDGWEEDWKTPCEDDLNSVPDTEQMKKYNLYDIGKTYFLASKIHGDEAAWICGYYIKTSSGNMKRAEWDGDPDGEFADDIGPYGLRGVFTLKTEGLTFTFNDEKKAYEISVQ